MQIALRANGLNDPRPAWGFDSRARSGLRMLVPRDTDHVQIGLGAFPSVGQMPSIRAAGYPVNAKRRSPTWDFGGWAPRSVRALLWSDHGTGGRDGTRAVLAALIQVDGDATVGADIGSWKDTRMAWRHGFTATSASCENSLGNFGCARSSCWWFWRPSFWRFTCCRGQRSRSMALCRPNLDRDSSGWAG